MNGPTCAVCRQPLAKGQPMAIAGTEAVHKACSPRLAQSVLTRCRDELIRQRHVADEAIAAVREASDQVMRSEQDVVRLRAERDHLRLESSQLRHATAQSEMEGAARGRREMQAVIDRLTVERDTARRERDNARQELELQQVLSGTQTASSGPAKGDSDAASTRFSLLELDVP
jgi:hypothetical protein